MEFGKFRMSFPIYTTINIWRIIIDIIVIIKLPLHHLKSLPSNIPSIIIIWIYIRNYSTLNIIRISSSQLQILKISRILLLQWRNLTLTNFSNLIKSLINPKLMTPWLNISHSKHFIFTNWYLSIKYVQLKSFLWCAKWMWNYKLMRNWSQVHCKIFKTFKFKRIL